jgi:hypothetical protein
MEDFIDCVKYRTKFYFNRFICKVVGCNIKFESGWNMPDDWSRPSYCARCGAYEDAYGWDSTDYELVYEYQNIYGTYKMIREGRWKF